MLDSLKIQNFTAFGDIDFRFSPNVNLIVGENGTGKTHLIKLAYCICVVQWEEGRKAKDPTKSLVQTRLADKLVGVFRPESLGRLARRRQGRERCDVSARFHKPAHDLGFSFATNSKSEVQVEEVPSEWLRAAAVYLPTRELLTIYPGFVSMYDSHYLEFEETWRDTCVLLGAPFQRGPRPPKIQGLLALLEQALEGSIELDNKSGRFYLRSSDGRVEMPLVAEGLRKIAMLAQLVGTGALLDKGFLFWDEPEANLNPKLVRFVARALLDLSLQGLQVFLATHSLFLLREIELLLVSPEYRAVKPAFFGLQRDSQGVKVSQGPSADDMGDVVALEEELAQSERFLKV